MICIAGALLIGCGAKENRNVILATTTSAYDTGLLDQIEPLFREKTGYNLKIIAVGTGQALRMGREKIADVILVHSKPDEEEFVAKGYGIERVPVMHNDFVILGPRSNPARIGIKDATVDAFRTIATTKSLFVSRGDNSGTHKKENALWEDAGITRDPKWYIEAGQGMGASLKIADEKQAYILSDRGTFYSMENTLGLVILNPDGKHLLNFYSVIEVTPGPGDNVNTIGAHAFRDFITSKECQQLIRDFRKNNKQLFHPDAI